MGDMALAFVFAFTPFTLGRIILLCIDEGDYYASTTSILLIGYGFIFSLGTAFAGMYTSRQYLRGECLDIVIFFGSLPGIIKLRAVANILINMINTAIVCPLLYAWSLDICTSKIFGTTMPVRFKHLFASSYSSISLHWIIGCALWDLGSTFSRLHSTVLINYVCCLIVLIVY
jgi:E3 ubiquitin-protein ligase MARCH6